MNLLSKLVLALLLCVLVAITFLCVRLEHGYKAQKEMHAQLMEKIDNSGGNKIDPRHDTDPEPVKKRSFGLDISHWDGDIVNEIPAIDNISFLICKATQGALNVDPDFRSNWTMIKEKGVARGAYHFYIYDEDPIDQAIHFCNTVGPLDTGDMPLVLDVEELSLPRRANGVSKSKLQHDVSVFLETVYSRTKRKPIVYMDYAFANKYFDNDQYAKYPLWLAEYSGGPYPKIPDTWKSKGCTIWQKSDKYNVNSIEADFDVFEGAITDLQQY